MTREYGITWKRKRFSIETDFNKEDDDFFNIYLRFYRESPKLLNFVSMFILQSWIVQ